LKKISYLLGFIVFLFVAFLIFKNANLNNFIDMVENRTFDLRQSILVNSGSRKPDKDIAIVAVDDASYEYILSNYGEWPLPRDIYAKLVKYLEKQNPKAIAFDLMFVNSMKSSDDADNKLTDAIISNPNVFTALNFDNQPEDLRIPPELPNYLSVDVQNKSKVNFSDLTFTNCRSILKSIIDGTNNIGIINVSRADDGILRRMPLFVKYKDKFYPQLALKVAQHYIGDNTKTFVINKNATVNFNGKDIHLDKDGNVILNWYGASGTYDYIPIYKLIKAANGEGSLDYDFSNKVVYFGTTASSLFDIKTVPVGRIYPGVEVQATYVNNFIHNDFIHRIPRKYTLAISLVLAALIIFVVMKISSVFMASLISASVYSMYLIFSYYLMKYTNMWLEVIYPLIFAIVAFTCAYMVKYLIKSRDFDTQYKLATTDGLTDLYNHRYFQDQMKFHVAQAERYEQPFSLIILDIDFFKKFNDTYGHQVGDAVLRLVASTLKHNVRATDIVCRYGGEEMSIILPNSTKEEAVMTAEKICQKISEQKLKIAGEELGVTVSLGVSTYPQDGKNPSSLIAFADGKLYLAKNSGRNKVGK
jgi:diguanylate cyclase (GGDEF)-like protein